MARVASVPHGGVLRTRSERRPVTSERPNTTLLSSAYTNSPYGVERVAGVSLVSGEGVAALGAVSELVISLSIAQRSHLTYGPGHAVALRTTEKTTAALARALALEAPIVLRFTPKAVFLGRFSLERNHPIYRAFAERLWKHGVASLSFLQGAGEKDLVALIGALNQAARELATREQAETLLRAARLERIEVRFLRQLLTHEVKNEVQSISREEAQRQWEVLMGQLAAIAGALPGRGSAAAEQAEGAGTGMDTGVSGVESGVPAEPHAPAPDDYAGAVIDYLKQLHQAKQRDAALQQTGLGVQISELIANLNPELRRQLATTALTAPDVTAEELHDLVHSVGYDTLVDTLQRLNQSGQAIPPTAFRTLSMLAMVQDDGITSTPAGATPRQPTHPPHPPEELQRLLDGLLCEEHVDTYAAAEYHRILVDAERHAQRLKLQRGKSVGELGLSPEDGERHFALVATELLHSGPPDPKLAAHVYRESQRCYVRLLEGGSGRGWREAMAVGRQAAAALGGAQRAWAWERPETLEMLRQRLTEGDRWQAEESVDQLVAIGKPALPLLLEVLAVSDSLSVRRRTLAGIESFTDDPGAELVALLDAEQSWYVQRNAVYLLRKRRDPAGAVAAKALWRRGEARVRLEIVGYLLAIEDAERLQYLDQALHDGDPAQVLATARMVLKQPTRETLTAIVRRSEEVPADQIGQAFHMNLLRAMATTRHPQALHYVAELPARRRPVLPWQRAGFRKEVEAMVAGTG